MFSDEHILKIVENKIKIDEEVSATVGGDDFGQVDYKIITICQPVKVEKGWKIKYKYITSKIMEFTFWPESKSYEYLHEKSLIINNEGKVIDESQKVTSCIGGGDNFGLDIF